MSSFALGLCKTILNSATVRLLGTHLVALRCAASSDAVGREHCEYDMARLSHNFVEDGIRHEVQLSTHEAWEYHQRLAHFAYHALYHHAYEPVARLLLYPDDHWSQRVVVENVPNSDCKDASD